MKNESEQNLMDAIAQNDFQRVKIILKKNKIQSLDFFDALTKRSPFMQAIQFGAVESFTELVYAVRKKRTTVHIDQPNGDGINALMFAVLNKQHHLIKKLVFLGASPAFQTHIKEWGNDIVTPFEMAVNQSDSKAVSSMIAVVDKQEVARLLLAGAQKKGDVAVFDRLLSMLDPLNKEDLVQQCLIPVCEQGDLEKLDLLVKQGVDLTKTVDGYGALLAAARKGQTDVVDYLMPLLRMDNINAPFKGVTPLGAAVWNGCEKTAVHLLRDKRVDTEIILPNNQDVLMTAIELNLKRVAAEWIRQKLPVHAFDGREAPLLKATRHDAVEIIKMLCGAGAYKETRDDEGMTPFLVAVLHKNYQAAVLLKQAGADVNAVDNKGKNAIHLCVQNKAYKALSWLVQSDVDFDKKDKNGKTPLMYAALSGDLKMYNLLIKAGAAARISDSEGKTAAHYLVLPPALRQKLQTTQNKRS